MVRVRGALGCDEPRRKGESDARENPGGTKIRLIGVRVEKLLREPGGAAAQAHLVLGNEAGLDPSEGTEEVRG